MDELQLVKEAYGEPAPPTMRDTAAARTAMFGRPPRVRGGWRLKAGIGVVAAGAATAVAVALVGSGSPAPPSPPASVDLGKRAVLAAAEKAGLQPSGKYWYSDTVGGQAYVVRAKTGTYAIFGAHTETFAWIGAKPGMGEANYARDLPAHPQTARDAALWRKAGSPSSIRVWSGDNWATYTTKATKWRSDGPNVGIDLDGGGKFVDGKSVEDLRNLPTDPDKLAEMFLGEELMPEVAKMDPKRRQGMLASGRLLRTSAVLRAPIPPKVRSGLMKALAAQPGMRAIGRVTDPLGRRGVALAADDRAMTVTGGHGGPATGQGTYRSRQVIIFDERTGALLSRQNVLTKPGGPYAEMKPGFVIEYEASRSAGWTNTKPNPPATLPF